MSNPAFATSDEFEDRIGEDLLVSPGDEISRADALLIRASDLVRAAAKQTISLVESDTLTMPGRNDERILLPQRPVVSVASVTIDGAALIEGTHWYLEKNSIVRMPTPLRGDPLLLDSPFLLGTSSRGFGWPTQTIEIVYTHGYDEDSAEYALARETAIQAVVRVWVNPGSLIQERVGNTEATYAPYASPPRGLMLTKDEKRDLARTFGRVAAGSIPIGG